MSYLGKPGKPGGCESCGSACGCHNCRSKLPSGGMAGLGERYQRDEEEGVSGWGFAYAAAPRGRRVVRRGGGSPSVRRLQEEVFRLRRQLRAALGGRIPGGVRAGPVPAPDSPPERAPEITPPQSPPNESAPPESAPPEPAPADAPPPEGGPSGWFGDETPRPLDIVRVRGIPVARTLAPRLAALLAAAEADGVHLGGSGSRSRGLAVDFTQHGRALTRESGGFRWLVQNAAHFGFRNLPSEPWHWSANGR